MPSLREAVQDLLDAPAPASMPDQFAAALAELRANRGHWAETLEGATTDAERAIRRDERRRIRQLLDGDVRRCAHVIGGVLADPGVDRDPRQKMARLFTPAQRKFLRELLDGDFTRLSLFMAVLVELLDPDDTQTNEAVRHG